MHGVWVCWLTSWYLDSRLSLELTRKRLVDVMSGTQDVVALHISAFVVCHPALHAPPLTGTVAELLVWPAMPQQWYNTMLTAGHKHFSC